MVRTIFNEIVGKHILAWAAWLACFSGYLLLFRLLLKRDPAAARAWLYFGAICSGAVLFFLVSAGALWIVAPTDGWARMAIGFYLLPLSGFVVGPLIGGLAAFLTIRACRRRAPHG